MCLLVKWDSFLPIVREMPEGQRDKTGLLPQTPTYPSEKL